MKNFSDLLAINADIEIKISVTPICNNGNPRCRILINDQVCYDDVLSGAQHLSSRVGLNDAICITVEMSDKVYSQERETAVVIDQIAIDGFDLIPDCTHLAHYENDQSVQTGPVSYLGFNGTWTLDIKEPFYRWRHRVTGQGWLLEPTTKSLD